MDNLEQKLKNLPTQPGVYIYRNKEGKVIYVGKAISLRSRVNSYFQSGHNHSAKTSALVENIADMEYIVTDTEVEALILECNLIKRYQPRYNVRLKDDKSYPYIKITLADDYPRVFSTRRMVKDGSRYFGPFTQVGAVNETLKTIKKIFPVRSCHQKIIINKSRPCLNYHIKQCLAPCCAMVSKQEYQEIVDKIVLLLEGKHDEIITDIRAKMEQCSENMEYEKAAQYRDQITAIEKVREKQKIAAKDNLDQDVIAMAAGDAKTCVEVFFIRGGNIVGREHYLLDDADEDSPAEIITAFVQQFYHNGIYIPQNIILQYPVDNADIIKKWLTQQRGSKVELKVPKRGEKLKLIQMVAKNAQLAIQEQLLAEMAAAANNPEKALQELMNALQLPIFPARMECYDISNIQGAETTASMVVFENGKPAVNQYRKFRIKSVEGPNDYASMQEVIFRRFKRAIDEQEKLRLGKADAGKMKFSRLPDLVIIDGGKGQLNAAREVMKRLGFGGITTFGLAKEEELLFSENSPDPIRLPEQSPALHVLQQLRDESHRFAITYHRQLRSKRNFQSLLDEIEGIGSKRRKNLMLAYKNLEQLTASSVEELAAVPGMNKKAAEAVCRFFHEQT